MKTETSFSSSELGWFMSMALEEADKGFKLGEVPVGAVLVDAKGDVLSRSHNLKETTHNPIYHAEIVAIEQAAKKRDTWRMLETTLFVTLEPCPMCLFAMMQARISNLVFGAYDPKGGSLSLGYYMHQDKRFNHSFNVYGGVKHFECSKILSDFFRLRRKGHLV